MSTGTRAVGLIVAAVVVIALSAGGASGAAGGAGSVSGLAPGAPATGVAPQGANAGAHSEIQGGEKGGADVFRYKVPGGPLGGGPGPNPIPFGPGTVGKPPGDGLCIP